MAMDFMGWTSMERPKSRPVAMLQREVKKKKKRAVMRSSCETRKEVQCDEKLKSIFEGREKVGILEVGRLLFCHFYVD